LVVQSEFRHTWSSVDGCRLLPTDWDMSAAEGVWDLLPDASTNLVQAYHLWTITVGETGTSARGAAEAECVLVLQQESSNRGVISFSVQEVDPHFPPPPTTDRPGDEATPEFMDWHHQLQGEADEVTGRNRAAPVRAQAAWSWRRGALVESIMVKPGRTYLIAPLGMEDQDKLAGYAADGVLLDNQERLAASKLLLRVYSPEDADVELWRNGRRPPRLRHGYQ